MIDEDRGTWTLGQLADEVIEACALPMGCRGTIIAALGDAKEQGRTAGGARVVECPQCAECAPYLKPGETPAQRIERERRDSEALETLLAQERRRTEGRGRPVRPHATGPATFNGQPIADDASEVPQPSMADERGDPRIRGGTIPPELAARIEAAPALDVKPGGRSQVDRLRDTLTIVLAHWPKQEILDELEPDDTSHSRHAPLQTVPRTKQVRAWRKTLAESGVTSPVERP